MQPLKKLTTLGVLLGLLGWDLTAIAKPSASKASTSSPLAILTEQNPVATIQLELSKEVQRWLLKRRAELQKNQNSSPTHYLRPLITVGPVKKTGKTCDISGVRLFIDEPDLERIRVSENVDSKDPHFLGSIAFFPCHSEQDSTYTFLLASQLLKLPEMKNLIQQGKIPLHLVLQFSPNTDKKRDPLSLIIRTVRIELESANK